MSSATFGTANEDNAHLSKSESKAVRRRSLALLGSLIRPVRRRFWLTIAAVVLSQAARVAGPVLIGLAVLIAFDFGAQTMLVEFAHDGAPVGLVRPDDFIGTGMISTPSSRIASQTL